VYLEKFIEEPHHIEIQVAGRPVWRSHSPERARLLGAKAASEVGGGEAPSPFVDEALRKKMGAAAVKAGEGY